MTADAREWMTLAEAARLCGHSPVTLRQAAQRGALHTRRVGEGRRATLYTTRDALHAYLANRRTWRAYGTDPATRDQEMT